MLNRAKLPGLEDKSKKKEKIGDSTKVNPWDIINALFDNKPIDTVNAYIPVLLILRMMSFEKYLLLEQCDKLNYFYPLSIDEWVKLMRVCFNGRKTYIDYVKKHAEKENKLLSDYRKQVKRYFSWSDREYGANSYLLKLDSDFPQLLGKLGFSESDCKKISKKLKEKEE